MTDYIFWDWGEELPETDDDKEIEEDEKMNEFDLKKFATRLIALRKETGHKKREIADKLGVIPQTYIRYELGQRHASLDFVVKASQYFNVSVDYMLGMTDVRNNSESQNNKPCPFCGCKAITVYKDFMIQCDGCQTIFAQPQPKSTKPQSMLERWNRRVDNGKV